VSSHLFTLSARTEEEALKSCDVIILGGGPAGSATALSLRAESPSLSVTLVEASSYDRPRIGEVLPAIARTLMNHLGIWEAFQAERFQTARSISSAWGHPFRAENHFIYSLHGQGWHLDRRRFDAFLSDQAASRGAEVRLAARAKAVERLKNAWHLRLEDGTEINARFAVDATGRRAIFARRMGARQIMFDRLAGFARFFTLEDNPEPGTLIESFSEGWWYTALAGGSRVVTCMTDADIARRLGLRHQQQWLDKLSETSWMRRSIGGATIQGSPLVSAANSAHLEPVCAEDWLAVGDAASAFDPLSSQGIVKALRSGIFASYAIADRLGKSDSAGLERYQSFVRREFSRYRQSHAEYCGQEQRWPDSCFWSRRQS